MKLYAVLFNVTENTNFQLMTLTEVNNTQSAELKGKKGWAEKSSTAHIYYCWCRRRLYFLLFCPISDSVFEIKIEEIT